MSSIILRLWFRILRPQNGSFFLRNILNARTIGTVQLMLSFLLRLEGYGIIWRFLEILRVGLHRNVNLLPNIRRSNRYFLLTSRCCVVAALRWFFNEALSVSLPRSKLNLRG